VGESTPLGESGREKEGTPRTENTVCQETNFRVIYTRAVAVRTNP
jgi:hypothetical protein